MNEIAYDYYVRHGYKKWATRAKKESQEIQKQYQFHRTRAEIARQQSVEGISNPRRMPYAHSALILHSVLDTESENIRKVSSQRGSLAIPTDSTSLASIRPFSENNGN